MRAVTLAIYLAATATGCSGISGGPVSPVATPSQVAPAVVKPTQQPVAPPGSAKEAIRAATATVSADESVLFRIFAGELPGDSIEAYETGTWLQDMRAFIDAIGDEEGVIGAAGRANAWLPASDGASVSTLESDGESYPFGVVSMEGCFQNRWKLDYSSPDFEPTPAPVLGLYSSYLVTVQYDPTRRVWLISDETDLGDGMQSEECTLDSP